MDIKFAGTKVLYAGQYWPGSNTIYIARAFEKLGMNLRWFDEKAFIPRWTSIRGRVLRQALFPLIKSEWNRQFIEAFKSYSPDLVYIAMGHLCSIETIEEIKKYSVPIICFYHDVRWRNKKNSLFERNISYYDLVVTTRPWHRPEFLDAGAKNVVVTRFGYDPDVHRPLKVPPKLVADLGSDVVFIGTNEPYRAKQLSNVMQSSPSFSFRLWGGGWNRLQSDSCLLPYWQGRVVYEQEIPVIYAASKVALHWVGWEPNGKEEQMRKGDQHNSRTFQIAACGGAMMMAQRTPEHERLFTEDKEAIYFDSTEELRDKLEFWLTPERDNDRSKIAAAARVRCQKEDYSYLPVVRQILDGIEF